LVLLGFIRQNRDLSMGYTDFQIRIFPLVLRPVAKARLARRAFGSDYRHNVGHLLIFTRGESKNCVVSLSGFSSGRRSGWIPLAQGAIVSKQQLTQ
jgi:hypothetical protein